MILDLEDAVAVPAKLQAREELARLLAASPFSQTTVLVRVNDQRSEFFLDDLAVSVSRGSAGIVLPKCETPDEVSQADSMISALEKEKDLTPGITKLFPLIESAAGVVRAFDLACSSSRIVALLFGAEDYCSDMGFRRTKSGREISYARLAVTHAARAAGIRAVDTVFTDLEDLVALEEEARSSRQMGFQGKLLIHPCQIEPVHRGFAPSREEIGWARRVVEAMAAAWAEKTGVVVVDGKMVDEPILRQAKSILGLAQLAENELPQAKRPGDE